jgi:DNA-binding response OmpR family regulator
MYPQTRAPASPRDDLRVADPLRLADPAGRQKILIADDEEDIRQLILAILAGSGFEVDTVSDGERAWEAVRQGHYDLLIADNEMPRLTGMKLIERIRASGMSLPVVIVSGSLALELVPDHLQLQIAAIIAKPFDIDEFLNVVQTVLRPKDGEANTSGGTVANALPPDLETRPHHVLIVEDDSIVRDSLVAALESEGYVVDEANSGMEAVSHAIEHVPDIVLLDLNMPYCDGWTTFSQLDRLTPLVPVIVITARPNQYEQAVRLRVDAFMEKPLNLPVLVRAIKRLTDEDENRHVRRITNPAFVTQLLDNNYS